MSRRGAPRLAVRNSAGRREEEGSLDVLLERCCGLDVHKKVVVVCVVITPPHGEPGQDDHWHASARAQALGTN